MATGRQGLRGRSATPGVFTVEQHVRGKWACRQRETLIKAPVPPQVIDKGIPTAGLAIPRSTLAQWVGQTGVQLQPLVDALRESVDNV